MSHNNIIDLSKVDIVVSDNVEFIDQGSNFNGITCPRCKSEIDMEWWQDSMGTASESNFESLNFLLPCCEEVCSLNDLEYDWPAGFAKFSIQISNLKGEVDSSIVQKLEDIISCRIRKVWAQY